MSRSPSEVASFYLSKQAEDCRYFMSLKMIYDLQSAMHVCIEQAMPRASSDCREIAVQPHNLRTENPLTSAVVAERVFFHAGGVLQLKIDNRFTQESISEQSGFHRRSDFLTLLTHHSSRRHKLSGLKRAIPPKR